MSRRRRSRSVRAWFRDVYGNHTKTPARAHAVRRGRAVRSRRTRRAPEIAALPRRHAACTGARHLALAQRLGANGVVAPVCTARGVDASAPGYGYRPAVDAIARRVSAALRRPSAVRARHTPA